MNWTSSVNAEPSIVSHAISTNLKFRRQTLKFMFRRYVIEETNFID